MSSFEKDDHKLIYDAKQKNMRQDRSGSAFSDNEKSIHQGMHAPHRLIISSSRRSESLNNEYCNSEPFFCENKYSPKRSSGEVRTADDTTGSFPVNDQEYCHTAAEKKIKELSKLVHVNSEFDTVYFNTESPSFIEGFPTIDGIWKLKHLIGAGSTGLVFRASHVETGEEAAVKIVQECGFPQIALFRNEMRVYKHLLTRQAIAKVPAIKYQGGIKVQDNNFQVVVMDLLGVSLNNIYKLGCRYPPKVVSEVGVKLLKLAEDLHIGGVIHGDLYFSNVATSLERSDELFLFDFGMSITFADDKSITDTMSRSNTLGLCFGDHERFTVDNNAETTSRLLDIKSIFEDVLQMLSTPSDTFDTCLSEDSYEPEWGIFSRCKTLLEAAKNAGEIKGVVILEELLNHLKQASLNPEETPKYETIRNMLARFGDF